MGFESGSVSLSLYYLPERLPSDYISRFQDRALPPLETLGDDPLSGWVTGRHLLDRDIKEETAHVSGWLRLDLVKAERKIPRALLQAECKMEELAHLAAEGKDRLDRNTKIQIRESVTERLLPTMPPTLTSIPMIYHPGGDVVFAAATSDKQLDAFMLSFREATGITPIPLTPETAAVKRRKVDVRDIPATSFSPEIEDLLAGNNIGMDFLTWLWFACEVRGGIKEVEGETCAIMVEGPLTFFMEGNGAHVAVLRQGEPLVASEAKAALLSGKKLQRAKVVMARGDESWSATVDAQSFLFRGLKLPKGEAYGAEARFEERMMFIERFCEVFLFFYDSFLEERGDAERWKSAKTEIHEWVSSRIAKA